MGETRSKSSKGAARKNNQIRKKKDIHNKEDDSRIISWFPITKFQRDQFINFTIRGSWIGIGGLVVLWLVVRIIGPAAGWWIPADSR